MKRPCALRRALLFNPDEIIFYMLSPTGFPRTTMLWKYSITPESETSKDVIFGRDPTEVTSRLVPSLAQNFTQKSFYQNKFEFMSVLL